MNTPRPSVSPETLQALSAHARLPMPEERVGDAAATLQLIQSLIDALDDVDLGDTPPATTFDARWS